MTQYKDRKAKIRARMAQTGESYAEAARQIDAAAGLARLTPPPTWRSDHVNRLRAIESVELHLLAHLCRTGYEVEDLNLDALRWVLTRRARAGYVTVVVNENGMSGDPVHVVIHALDRHRRVRWSARFMSEPSLPEFLAALERAEALAEKTEPPKTDPSPFRSPLEAYWAQALDELKIPWQYEPTVIRLPNGQLYRPDFYLYSIDTWVEVKGHTIPGQHKPRLLADIQWSPVVIARPSVYRTMGPRAGTLGLWWDSTGLLPLHLAYCVGCHHFQWIACQPGEFLPCRCRPPWCSCTSKVGGALVFSRGNVPGMPGWGTPAPL
jgi:hypothetical protein